MVQSSAYHLHLASQSLSRVPQPGEDPELLRPHYAEQH